MILFPAIDMLSGSVVRLRKGKRSEVDVYSTDPLAVAESFAAAGASWVHMVDLSAAFEEDDDARAANDRAIRAVCDQGLLSVDVGGGVRSLERVRQLADMGCERISLGTPLVRDPEFAARAAELFGPMIVGDVAAERGRVRVNGWRDDAPLLLDELLRSFRAMGIGHLVYTDIARDGTGAGIDAGAYASVAAQAGFPVVASGGVSAIADIRALAALGPEVIEGVIVGRALYEGTVDLAEAVAVTAAATVPSADKPRQQEAADAL